MRGFIKILLVWFLGLILLGLSLWSLSMVYAANPRTLYPAYLIASDDPYILVDDFADGDYKRNRLGGPAECGATNQSLITCTNVFSGENEFLQMQYDVSMSSSEFALYTSDIISRNLTDFETVWVVIKGEKGLEPVEAELVECNSPSYPKQLINNYLIQGIITSEWSAAAIPISSFSPLNNRTCIWKVNILARNSTGNKKGTIYIDDIRFLSSQVLVDDFPDLKRENELGGDSGFWPDVGCITYSYPDGELRIDYDVKISSSCPEAVYWTGLGNSKLFLQKDAISFKVRGNKGTEFAVQFMDCTTHVPSIKVSDYLRGGINTEEQYVTIPLAAFADGLDWRCIKEVKFLFSAHPWIDSNKGPVYIDDVTIAPTTSNPVPLHIDHFDDCNNWNALLGAWGNQTLGNASINVGFDQGNNYSLEGCSLRLTYAIIGSSAAWVRSDLRGVDVRDYTHLRFFLKGAVGNEELHVRLFDEQGKFRLYEDIKTTNKWQEILIPLKYFSPVVNLANLSELTIAFEWKTMNGTIYLDDIRFVKPPGIGAPFILKDASTTNLFTNLYLRNHTGGAVSYTVHGVGTKAVPNTLGGPPFFWGRFPIGTYNVSWYKISEPACKYSRIRTYPVGNFEPPSPMICY